MIPLEPFDLCAAAHGCAGFGATTARGRTSLQEMGANLRLVVIGLALVFAASALAQQTQPPPLKLDVETRLVLVDLVVLDKADRAVPGLKQEDFVVKEDGKERPILSFTAFRGSEPLASPSPGDPTPASPSTAPGPSAHASTVLFIDDNQLTPQDAARLLPALKRVVDIVAEQEGILAMVAPGSDVQLADEPARNRAGFRAAIDRIVGLRIPDRSDFPLSDAEAILADQGDATVIDRLASRFVYLNPQANAGQNQLHRYEMAKGTARSRAMEVAVDARNRREHAYKILLGSLNWLASRPGRRSILMVSGGYANDKEDRGIREIVNRSLRANTPIHFLDARAMRGMSRYLGVEYREALEHDGMETPLAFSDESAGAAGLAADTGGLYVRNSSDMEKGLSRILEMTATYYVLGYEPPEQRKPGFRKIKVEVVKKDLKVTARRGYFDDAAPR
jgi:VWFA-related protein